MIKGNMTIRKNKSSVIWLMIVTVKYSSGQKLIVHMKEPLSLHYVLGGSFMTNGTNVCRDEGPEEALENFCEIRIRCSMEKNEQAISISRKFYIPKENFATVIK